MRGEDELRHTDVMRVGKRGGNNTTLFSRYCMY